MNADLLDHAARVLAAEPTRSMPVETLYEKIGRSRGPDVSLRRFIEAVERHTSHFAVVTPAPAVDDAWTERERCAYAAVLSGAGLNARRVILAGRPDDALQVPPAQSGGVVGGAAAPRAYMLNAVHESLADLVYTAGGSTELAAVLSTAVHELEAVRSALD